MKRIIKTKIQATRAKRKSAQGKEGFSLVELMVGSTVLTLVLAGSFSGLGQALCISEVVQSSNFASQLLQSEMDEIHLMQWNEVNRLEGTSSFDPRKNFSSVPLRDYSCTRVISQKGSSQKEVRLTVGWTDLRGKPHNREYVTYYTKEGLFDYSYRTL